MGHYILENAVTRSILGSKKKDRNFKHLYCYE